MADQPLKPRREYAESVNYVGSTIKDGAFNNLQISWDQEDGFVMLFTPDMADPFPHYHIELARDEAEQLALFLSKKLGELSENADQTIKETEFQFYCRQ